LKITIATTGNLGLSNAVLLAQNNEVATLESLVDMLNSQESGLQVQGHWSKSTVIPLTIKKKSKKVYEF
jgi:hypothetical protein